MSEQQVQNLRIKYQGSPGAEIEEEDFWYLLAEVEELEGKLKERDEWEDQANQQCIRNDKLQAENADLKAQKAD